MQIRVDPDLCEANAVCCGLAPDVFELDDDERLVIAVSDVSTLSPEGRRSVERAVERCPKNALELAP